MNKEIKYRLTRVILVISFLIITIFLKNNINQKYNNNMNIYHSLLNNLEVINLTKPYTNKSINQESVYNLKVINNSNYSKNVTISLTEDKNNTIDLSYVNYEVIENNKLLKAGTITNNKLYTGKITKHKESTYQIKFWVDDKIKQGKFLAQLNIT